MTAGRSQVPTATDVPLISVNTSGRRFPLQLSERKLLLGLVDLLTVNAALLLTAEWRLGQPIVWSTLTNRASWYLVLSGLWLIVSFLLDAYNLRRAARLRTGIALGAVTAFATALMYLAIPYVTPALPQSRLSLFVFVGTMVCAVAAWRGAYALLLVQPPPASKSCGCRRRTGGADDRAGDP